MQLLKSHKQDDPTLNRIRLKSQCEAEAAVFKETQSQRNKSKNALNIQLFQGRGKCSQKGDPGF